MYKDDLVQTSSYGTTFYIPWDIIKKENNSTFLENMAITKVGYFKNAIGHSVMRPGINEYVLLYCVEGNGWVQTTDKCKNVSKGELVILNKNLPHGYGTSIDNPWSIYWIHFIGKGVEDILRRLELTYESPMIHVGTRSDLVMPINDCLNTLSNGYSFSHLFHATTCLQSFFSNIFQIKTYAQLQNSNNINVESLIHFMKNNIREVYTLEEFADYMCMSKYHFGRKFKERTGYSPIEYFTRLKIQKACELLEASSLEIKVISEYLSFCNPYYFSEVFKKITGYSPRDYRKIHGAGVIKT